MTRSPHQMSNENEFPLNDTIAPLNDIKSPSNDTTALSNDIQGPSDKKQHATIDLTTEQTKLKRRRISHDASFKAEVIQKKEDGTSTADLIQIYKSFNVDKTKISKWMKNNDSIIKAAADPKKKKLFTIRPGIKYKELYSELSAVFKQARAKGHHVDFNWLWSKGRKIYREQTGDENVVLRKHVIANFIKRHKLKQRKIQRNNKMPKEHYREKMKNWHTKLRERVVRTGANDARYGKKFGYFLPQNRFNMDQSPLPFARDVTKTYEQVTKVTKNSHSDDGSRKT